MKPNEKLAHNITIADGELTKITNSALVTTGLTKLLLLMNLELLRISRSILLTYQSHLSAGIYNVDLIEMGLRKSIEIAIFSNWIVDQNDPTIVERILSHQSKAFESSWEIPDPGKFSPEGNVKGLPPFKNMSETTIKGAWLAYKKLSWLHHAATMQLYVLLEEERSRGGLSPKELFVRRSADTLNSQADLLEFNLAYLSCEILKIHPDKIELLPSIFK